MKEGLRLKIKEALDFRNSTMLEQLTIEELANLVLPDMTPRYSRKTFYCWNNGVYTPIPNPEDLVRIADICGVTVEFLLAKSSIPSSKVIDEEFVTNYLELLTVLSMLHNEDESPTLKKARHVWNRRFPF